MLHSTYSSLRRDNELFMRTEKAKNGRNRSKFALPKFYVTHRNYEILSKSLVPTFQTLYPLLSDIYPDEGEEERRVNPFVTGNNYLIEKKPRVYRGFL